MEYIILERVTENVPFTAPIRGQSSVAEELRENMDHREWEKLQVEWNS
jgi:hypothetical protein